MTKQATKIPRKYWQHSREKWEERSRVGKEGEITGCGYCDYYEESNLPDDTSCGRCSLYPIACGEPTAYFEFYIAAETRKTELKYARLILAAIEADGRAWVYIKTEEGEKR